MITRCVLEKKTLIATYNPDCLALADCVVVDVQCDYTKHHLGSMKTGEAEMAALEATLKTIGEKIQPKCLVLIETTVAPGTTEFVAWPILKKAFHARDHGRALQPTTSTRHAGRITSAASAISAICSSCNSEGRKGS
jgi:UDP-N-acetyl-D-mannosaminuronate dehydrogenase